MTGGGRQGSERADVGGTSWSLAGPPAPPLGLTSAVSLSELGEFVQQVEANQTLFDRRPWAADLETWEAADGLKADVIASHHALQVRLPTDGGLPPARNQRDAMQVDKTGVAISLVPCPPPDCTTAAQHCLHHRFRSALLAALRQVAGRNKGLRHMAFALAPAGC